MKKKHIALIALIVAGMGIGGGIGAALQNNQPAPRTDPISQEPIKDAPIGVQATVIVQGQFLADFKELTTTGNILINDVSYPVEYTDEWGENYAIRGVKHAENGKYEFKSEPTETAFDIDAVVASMEKEIIPVSNQVQPFVTYSGTFTDGSFWDKSTSGKIWNGAYGGSTVVRGEGNAFTVRAPARYLATHEFMVNHGEDETILTWQTEQDTNGVMRWVTADGGKLSFPNTGVKLVELGTIAVIPATK